MNILFAIVGAIFVIAGIVLSVVLGVQTAKENDRIDKMNEYRENPSPRMKMPKWPAVISFAGAMVIVVAQCFQVIPTGYTGVRTTFGLIDQESCMPGFNVVIPFVQKINLVNNKQQDLRFTDRVWAETKEQTVVYMEGIQVTYQIVPESSAWIYASVENWVEELVDADLTASALKSAARNLDAANVTDRAKIQSAGRDQLQSAVDEKYGEGRVTIKNIIVNNMDFEDSYNAAIAQKSKAMQEQQEQAIRNETAIAKAKAEADAARAAAQGQADAERILAQGKAEANKIISNSITDATQKQDMINAWNGELPKYIGGGDPTFGLFDAERSGTLTPEK